MEKEVHGPRAGYSITIESEDFPFVVSKNDINNYENSNDILQKFIKIIEKKFDAIWYIGSDFLGDDLYERFIFHHGGFLEVSLSGELRAFFSQDKSKKFFKALEKALNTLGKKENTNKIIKKVKSTKTLISIDESINKEEYHVKSNT